MPLLLLIHLRVGAAHLAQAKLPLEERMAAIQLEKAMLQSMFAKLQAVDVAWASVPGAFLLCIHEHHNSGTSALTVLRQQCHSCQHLL